GVEEWVRDRAAVRGAREAPGDGEAAGECCARARALAVRLDLRGVTAAVEALATLLGVEPAAATDAPPRQVVRHEGDHWTIEYGGRAFHLRDSKGIRLLAYLLSPPRREVHAVVLAAAADREPEAPGPPARRGAESRRPRA